MELNIRINLDRPAFHGGDTTEEGLPDGRPLAVILRELADRYKDRCIFPDEQVPLEDADGYVVGSLIVTD
jgi:hypothetical protein